MKKNYYMIFCQLLIVFIFSSCFNPWKGDEGNLTVIWGESEVSRAFVQQSELKKFNYSIKLTGPGETIQNSYNHDSALAATFTVIPGKWTVTVKGSTGGDLKVMGIEQVEVKSGQSSKEKINLYTVTEVSSWAELDSAVSKNDPVLSISTTQEEMIILKNSFPISNLGNIIVPRYTITIKNDSSISNSKN